MWQRLQRFLRCLLVGVAISIPAASRTADLLPGSPDKRFTVTVNEEIRITDAETRDILNLAPVNGAKKVAAFWAPKSDKVLFATVNGNGFTLFAAQIRGKSLAKLTVQDPNDKFYSEVQDALGIKFGNGAGFYHVYAEQLLGITWDGPLAKAQEQWSVAENLGEETKTFRFEADYVFEEADVKISEIKLER